METTIIFVTICRNRIKTFNSQREALNYTANLELKGYSVKVYRSVHFENDPYDILTCIYVSEQN